MRTKKHSNWLRPDIAGLFAAATVLLVIFIHRDRRSKDPIFPAELFSNRLFCLAIVAVFMSSIIMFGALSYMPLFAQMALGRSASDSGIILIPYVIALSVASTFSGQIVSRTGKYKALLLCASFVIIIGMFLLAHIDIDTGSAYLTFSMLLLGIGMGANLPIFM